MIGALTNLLPPHCLISAAPHAAACCLHVPSHACLVCMQRIIVSSTWMTDILYQPGFKHTSILATKGERRQWENRRGKKEGTVFLTHTVLSFCSVTLLRSAGPPFSQSWTTAKKTLSYRLHLQLCCFNSTHVSYNNAKHKNSTLHAHNALLLQL